MHGTIDAINERVCGCGGPKCKTAKRCLACTKAAIPPRKGSPICHGCGGTKSYLSHRYCLSCYTKHLGEPSEPAYISPWVEELDGTKSRYVTGGVVGPADVYAMRLKKGRRRKTKTRVRRWLGATMYLRPIGPPPRSLPEFTEAANDEVRPPIDRIKGIIHAACHVFELSEQDILGPSRLWKVVVPRQVVHALARHLTNRSMPDIGRRCGRDHSTIVHSVGVMAPIIDIVSRKMTTESSFSDWVRAMRPYAEEVKNTGRKNQTIQLAPSIKMQPRLPLVWGAPC